MTAKVYMHGINFVPARMCDDPGTLYFGQVRDDNGTVLARASRVYNQWIWDGPDGHGHALEHPGLDWDGQRINALTEEMIGILVAIAKAHNNTESEGSA